MCDRSDEAMCVVRVSLVYGKGFRRIGYSCRICPCLDFFVKLEYLLRDEEISKGSAETATLFMSLFSIHVIAASCLLCLMML